MHKSWLLPVIILGGIVSCLAQELPRKSFPEQNVTLETVLLASNGNPDPANLTPGTLTLTATQPGVTFVISGKAYAIVEGQAFPPGTYEVRAELENPIVGLALQYKTIIIEPGKHTSHTFSFTFGTLSLKSNRPEAIFAINARPCPGTEGISLPVGDYTVAALLPNPVLGQLRQEARVSVLEQRETTHTFNFNLGWLALGSNRPDAVFTVAGKEVSPNRPIPLPPDEYRVSAFLRTGNPILDDLVLSQNIRITAANTDSLQLNFALGTLTLSGSEEGLRYSFLDREMFNLVRQALLAGAREVLPVSPVPGLALSPGGASFQIVDKLLLPAGDWEITAILPRAPESGLMLEQRRTDRVTVTAGMHTDYHFDLKLGSLTLSAKLAGVSYNVDAKPLAEVRDLRLLAGVHSYQAIPPIPYSVVEGFVALEPDAQVTIPLKFKIDKVLRAENNRWVFYNNFGNGILRTLEINHYLYAGNTFSDWQGAQSAYKMIGNGISISGLNYKNIDAVNPTIAPNEVKYPQLYGGISLLDKGILLRDKGSGRLAGIIDLLSLTGGGVHLARGGWGYLSLDLNALLSYQPPLQSRIGAYTYAELYEKSKSAEQGYILSIVQPGIEAKFQTGLRLWHGNYLHLNFGTRYMGYYGFEWYEQAALDAWEAGSSTRPIPVNNPALPVRNVPFEGLTFYLGIGWDNNFIGLK